MALAIVSITVGRGGMARSWLVRCAEHPGWCVGVAVLAFLVATVTADITDGAVIELNATPSWELLTRS